MHSTNYYNGFVAVADDTTATEGTVPREAKNSPTIAQLQYEMISREPYAYTSDDVLFRVYAFRKDLLESEWAKAREEFFSKGQPCFRASPLTKQYGWGVHSDADGRVALYGVETPEYEKFLNDPEIKVVKAMKSKR